jgi:excinuclease UvrABC ATPase subunit
MIANMTAFSQHPADSHDLIRVQGARENNLEDVSVEIPSGG